MFDGNDLTLSINERDTSNPRARRRARALNSGTSVVYRRVTSMTGASPAPTASIGNAIRIEHCLRPAPPARWQASDLPLPRRTRRAAAHDLHDAPIGPRGYRASVRRTPPL